MKEIIVKIIFVAAAIATIMLIAIPALNGDGAKVKNKVTDEYKQMFQ